MNPRLMRCDPRNTGQVCLAVIANDRTGQKELTVILNCFFFSLPLPASEIVLQILRGYGAQNETFVSQSSPFRYEWKKTHLFL